MPVQGCLQHCWLLLGSYGLAGAQSVTPQDTPVKVAMRLLSWLQNLCNVPALRTIIGALLLCTSHGESLQCNATVLNASPCTLLLLLLVFA